jgi:primosomal replication protein N
MTLARNRLTLDAVLSECGAMRYTPAGIPAQDLLLSHESQQTELGQARTVRADIKAVAFGDMAERLARQTLGSKASFSGFLAAARPGKAPVFHIQDFQLI